MNVIVMLKEEWFVLYLVDVLVDVLHFLFNEFNIYLVNSKLRVSSELK